MVEMRTDKGGVEQSFFIAYARRLVTLELRFCLVAGARIDRGGVEQSFFFDHARSLVTLELRFSLVA